MFKTTCHVCLGIAVAALASSAVAQNDRPAGPRPIARNLDNPSGVTVNPQSGDVFIAEHRGIVRLSRQEGQRRMNRSMQVNKFPTDIYGKGPMYDIGPLGLAFWGNDQLVVGDGSRPDGQELVRIYKISSEAPEKPVAEDSAAYTLGPIKPGDASAMGEGNFYGVAATDDALYFTSNGDDTKGWILRSEIKDGKPGELTPFIATKEVLTTDAPCGLTINKEGDLVVGQMGEVNLPGDSVLAIFDAQTGKLKNQYPTGLSDIVGLAYSPTTGKLFAVDFSWADPKQGGLFELTVSGDKCTARKVFELDKPTAIAFTDNGTALITVVGTAEEGSDAKPGQLLRVSQRLLQ